MNTVRRLCLAAFCGLLLVLAGCSGPGKPGKGGYYKDDGPGSDIPANIAAIPDAVPRNETHDRANMRPYVVFGQRYVPIADERPFRQTGVASWYGRKFHGNKTANGETYDMYAMTAAHPTLPIPSYARVTRAGSGRSIIVRINDRGPFHSSRIIDLSYAAAAKLGLIGPGSGQVIVEAITNEDIRTNAWRRGAPAPSLAQAAPVTATVASVPAVPDALAALQHADPPAETGGSVVYLQFGAFSAQASAQALAARINAQLGQAVTDIATVDSADNQLYRVRIGPYPSRTAAVNAALQIQEQTGLQPLVAAR
jgi:rare lipoprotein A